KNTKFHQHEEESLIKARTIEEIGVWLINNSLYNENSIINLVPNPTYVTFDDIRKLYKAMYDFFNPVLKKTISFDQLLMKNRMFCLFVSINFYAPKQQRKVTEYTAIYLNSWGEMFCKSFYSEQGLPSMEETKQDIMNRTGIKKMPLNTAFYFSKGVAR
ncbi:MAG: adenylate cyclase, partial [Proteobacteria bacterium]|nr:adenylate cyclase [Pseudomonadota bacterium]